MTSNMAITTLLFRDSLLRFRQTDIRLSDDIVGDEQEAVRQSPGIGWTKAQDGFAEAHFNHIKPLGTTGNLHLLASDICNCSHLFLFSFCRLPGYARSIWRGNPTAGAAFPATGKGVLGELGDQLSVGHWLGVWA